MPTTTLLLDLDDTLLDTNTDSFAPAYFSALTSTLADLVSPDVMLPALLGGTKAMMKNFDPRLTLEDVFYNYFVPAVGMERESLQGPIDNFYDTVFPGLSYVTSQRPDAIQFVQWAFENHYHIGVATNPYFPLSAVHHRMRWAGLPPERFPFSLISSFETFHFTKEVTAFFPEFMAQIGWPEGPVVMVGNDLEMDLLPAQKAGFPVFWLREEPDDKYPEIPQGTFADLCTFLQNADQSIITPSYSSRDAIINILRSTPAAITSLIRNLSAETRENKSGLEELCLTEVLCHLRDVELEINLPRFKKMIHENNPFLPGIVSDEWIAERDYASQNGQQALETFVEARVMTIDLLTGALKDLSHTARHAIFGPITLIELAGIVAGHDRAHIQQIWKIIQAR